MVRWSNRCLTRHCESFATSSDAVAEQQAVSAFDQSFDQRLCDRCETFVLGGVDVEDVLEPTLRCLADYLVVDRAFRWNQRNLARVHHPNARQVGFTLQGPDAAENLHGISHQALLRSLATLRSLWRRHRACRSSRSTGKKENVKLYNKIFATFALTMISLFADLFSNDAGCLECSPLVYQLNNLNCGWFAI